MRGIKATYESPYHEVRAAQMRAWRAANPARAREISRIANAKERREQPQRVQQHRLRWARKNPAKIREMHVNYYDRLRADIVAFFGGKCVRCGFADARALQMDHLNGDGQEDRKGGFSLNKRWKLIKHRPEEARARFQLLCANCNSIKRFERHEFGNGKPRRLEIA